MSRRHPSQKRPFSEWWSCRTSLITVALLVAACGADGSDVVGDDLALAQQEVARLEALLAEQPEAAGTGETVVSDVSGSHYSVGPCGVFALNGTRVLELIYEVEEERSGGIAWTPPEGIPTWVETGVDFGKEHLALWAWKDENNRRDYQGLKFELRSPSVSFGVRLAPDWNHAWYVAWEMSPTFPDTSLLWRDLGFPRKISFPDEDWDRPGVQLRGFFGLDRNCEWRWIGHTHDWPVYAFDARTLSLKVGEDGEAQLVEYTVAVHDNSPCRLGLGGFWVVPAVYDLESHLFIPQCPDE